MLEFETTYLDPTREAQVAEYREEEVNDPARYQCEIGGCDNHTRLVERYYIDEDGSSYYSIKCPKHWSENDGLQRREA